MQPEFRIDSANAGAIRASLDSQRAFRDHGVSERSTVRDRSRCGTKSRAVTGGAVSAHIEGQPSGLTETTSSDYSTTDLGEQTTGRPQR